MERKRATSISENEMPTITQRIFASVMSLSDMLNPPSRFQRNDQFCQPIQHRGHSNTDRHPLNGKSQCSADVISYRRFQFKAIFIVNLNRIRLHFAMFSLPYSRSETQNLAWCQQTGFLLLFTYVSPVRRISCYPPAWPFLIFQQNILLICRYPSTPARSPGHDGIPDRNSCLNEYGSLCHRP